jgi:arsenate reductase
MNRRKPVALICRSQMAEAFLRIHQGDHYEVYSAGTDPADRVHPLAIQVMAEAGIDISGQRPKPLNQFLGKLPVGHLIIVCGNANRRCPRIWPGVFSRTFVPFDDPAGAEGDEFETLAVFRRVRDEIDGAIRVWQPVQEGIQHA